MNRAILFARILAIVILVVFALLMTNLYSKLRRLQQHRREPVVQPDHDSRAVPSAYRLNLPA